MAMMPFHSPLFVLLLSIACAVGAWHIQRPQTAWTCGARVGCNAMRLRTSLKCVQNDGYNAIMVVPTGVGATIGGYAGDALPAAKLLASVVDVLITHPNVMNGAMMYWPVDNILYVEGYALDEFTGKNINIVPVTKKSNKIGLLLDKGIEEELLTRHLQVADAARATLGLNVVEAVITSEKVGVKLEMATSGASWGNIENSNTLVEAARELVSRGCNAIAVVVRFPEDDEIDGGADEAAARFQAYREGNGVDGIAGAEAIISHIITKELMIPCAHAPAFEPTDVDANTSPKASAEELGYTFLPCVLSYLHRAPQFKNAREQDPNTISMDHIDAIVTPINALGGPSVLNCIANNKLVIAVEDNETSMDVPTDVFPKHKNIIKARSYAEAAGLLAAHKAGVLFESLTSTVRPIKCTSLTSQSTKSVGKSQRTKGRKKAVTIEHCKS